MVRAQRKVSMGLKILQYYTTKRWTFKNEHSKALFARMSPSDQKKFFFDCSKVDWQLYIKNYIMGMRTYLLNEPDSNLPKARKNLQRYDDNYLTFNLVIPHYFNILSFQTLHH